MSSTFYTGNSGQYTTGPHLDFKVWDVEKGTWVNPNNHTSILRVNGKPLTEQFSVTSGYGMRTHPTRGGQRMHHGIDYGTPGGTAVTVDGGTFISTYRDPAEVSPVSTLLSALMDVSMTPSFSTVVTRMPSPVMDLCGTKIINRQL